MARDSQSIGSKRSLVGVNNPYRITYGQQLNTANGGGSDWFGPLDPMRPLAPDSVKGRVLDYPSGFNLNTQPRSGEDARPSGGRADEGGIGKPKDRTHPQ